MELVMLVSLVPGAEETRTYLFQARGSRSFITIQRSILTHTLKQVDVSDYVITDELLAALQFVKQNEEGVLSV